MLDVLSVPFVPSSRDRVKTMVELANPKVNQRTLDLGSGDGRVVIELAKLGAISYGYDIDSTLVNLAIKNIVKEGLKEKAFIYEKNYWLENLSDFEIITIYGMTSIMGKLEIKLQNELKKGAKVLSNFFTFPTWPHVIKKGQVYLYVK